MALRDANPVKERTESDLQRVVVEVIRMAASERDARTGQEMGGIEFERNKRRPPEERATEEGRKVGEQSGSRPTGEPSQESIIEEDQRQSERERKRGAA